LRERIMNRETLYDPWIRKIRVGMKPPSLKDNTADVDRLIKGIEKEISWEQVKLPFKLAKRIPSLLRKWDYQVEPVLFKEGSRWHVIDMLPPNGNHPIYGAAVDLGSSTVVLRLLDLLSGEVVAERSFSNPQNSIGPDILTRIHFASREGGLDALQSAVIKKLNLEISEACWEMGIPTESIVGSVVAGNTTMTHLFLGLDPYWICREPYIPVCNRPDFLEAGALDLQVNNASPIFIFPNVGSYLGGDIISGILATGMYQQEEVSLMVDVGTNAEVVIGNRDWLMGCAGAAGPAIEGGVAAMGMIAGPGVIDKVAVDPFSREFRVRTIEGDPPIGICGSGLIDLVSQLYLTGMIDVRGKYVPDRCGERLTEEEGFRHLVIVSPEESPTDAVLTLSQPEIDALIRSKAAMYAILVTITRMVNMPLEEMKRFYIAGTFGSYIEPQSAITIGMLPDLPLPAYRSMGNTSIQGASMALCSSSAMSDICEIRDRITYVELNVNQDFMNRFSAASFIPHTDLSLFPSVEQWQSEWGSL
jgi:uncharacterized 2Fe-2S/4Fe-4S cluster protein (DUF4445 family)